MARRIQREYRDGEPLTPYQRLDQLRDQKGLSITAASERSGFSRSYGSRFFANKIVDASDTAIIGACTALETTPDSIGFRTLRSTEPNLAQVLEGLRSIQGGFGDSITKLNEITVVVALGFTQLMAENRVLLARVEATEQRIAAIEKSSFPEDRG